MSARGDRRAGAQRPLVPPAVGFFLLSFLAASVAPGAAMGPRKGQILLLDSADLSRRLRTYNGTARGGGFGASIDIAGLYAGAGGVTLQAGAPSADGGAGKLLSVDLDTRRVRLEIAAAAIGADLMGFGHAILNPEHPRPISHALVAGAPGGFDAAGEPVGTPTVVILDGDGPGPPVPRVTLTGSPGSLFGWDLTSFDDMDLDPDFGFSFFAVGAPTEDRGARRVDTGAVYGFDVRSGEQLWRRVGARRGEHLGYSLAGLGDLDADGISDLLVGAPGRRDRRPPGRVYVLSGRTGAILERHDAPAGAKLFGFDVAARDIDGDGFAELLVSAPMTDTAAGAEAGAVYVIARPAGAASRIEGRAAREGFGVALAATRDHDGDGLGELLVASLDGSEEPRVHLRGRLSIVSTDGRRLQEVTGKRAGDHLGVHGWESGVLTENGVDRVVTYVSVARTPIAFVPD